ncbi:phage tail protein, partial [Candidatus Kaiserbacteria bacterium]|nr:phage tail protein [Candidatus Kaiserbacteria bacterium]
MADHFLHGVEVVEIDNGPRPIRTVRSSVIGLVGTAPQADEHRFPLNTPVLIAGSRLDAAKLGSTGTLPMAIDGLFDQVGALVVVIRVAEGATDAETQSHVLGGVDEAGQYLGL